MEKKNRAAFLKGMSDIISDGNCTERAKNAAVNKLKNSLSSIDSTEDCTEPVLNAIGKIKKQSTQ